MEHASITKILLEIFPSLLCMTECFAVSYIIANLVVLLYLIFHYKNCKKSLYIRLVQSVQSNVAELKVNKLTC